MARRMTVEEYDRLAQEFERDTGMMAPGKDAPAAYPTAPIEERREAWRTWLSERTHPTEEESVSDSSSHTEEDDMYRQGDVMLVPTTEIPDDAERIEPDSGRIVLARGEATGHHHSLAAVPGVDLVEVDGARYLTVEEEPADLTHQEHNTIPVEPGTYRVVLQREYDVTEGWRRVLD